MTVYVFWKRRIKKTMNFVQLFRLVIELRWNRDWSENSISQTACIINALMITDWVHIKFPIVAYAPTKIYITDTVSFVHYDTRFIWGRNLRRYTQILSFFKLIYYTETASRKSYRKLELSELSELFNQYSINALI